MKLENIHPYLLMNLLLSPLYLAILTDSIILDGIGILMTLFIALMLYKDTEYDNYVKNHKLACHGMY